VERFTDHRQQFTLSAKIHSFTHTTISLFIKVTNSIKGFSELYKSHMQRENKDVPLREWLFTESPSPLKFNKGSKWSAESK